MFFDLLPNEKILEIVLFLSLADISRFSRINKRFTEIIFKSEFFWREIFIRDYGHIDSVPESWKSLYLNSFHVWTFGASSFGKLGHENDNEDLYVPTQLTIDKAKSVSTGDYNTACIDANNELWLWGGSSGENIPTKLHELKVKQISLGSRHTIALDLNNNIWVWGNGSDGQLGLGKDKPIVRRKYNWDVDKISTSTPIQIPDIKAIQVSTSSQHNVIIDTENNVWTFGNNRCGQLGLGHIENVFVPTKIPGIKAKFVNAGTTSSAIIDLENNVWMFGNGNGWQLGLGDEKQRNTPTQIPNFKAKSVSIGLFHTLAIDLDDNLWVWGSNTSGYNINGQLGFDNIKGSLTPVQLPLKARKISAGSYYSAAIDIDANLWLWGTNNWGQLGFPKHIDKLTKPTRLSNFKVKDVSCAGCHTIMIASKVI